MHQMHDVAQVQHGAKTPALWGVQLQEPCRRHTSSELRGWERAELQYSDADCGAFINRVSYTHHPACIGCTVENGRLALSGRYRENSVDWDTNHTLRHIRGNNSWLWVEQPTISAHTTDILVPTPAVRMQGELQTSYYKAFICIIDVAVANYRPAEIGGENYHSAFNQRGGRSLRNIIIISFPVNSVQSTLPVVG